MRPKSISSVIPSRTEPLHFYFNLQRPRDCPHQDIDYRQMDDQICTPPLKLPLLLHKNSNGDDIKDDNGQTFDDEDHKPWNAL